MATKKRKVDIFHGMGDDRWTTKDKITQYRGLIKFFAREQQQRLFENNILKRKQGRQIRELRKDIDYFRDKLYDCIFGDRQRLRNCLQHNRTYMLAFQNLVPPIVVEHIKQQNLTKRKELDSLKYKKEQRMKVLKNLQITAASLEDSIELINGPSFRYSEQILVNQIQDISLRYTTAKNINKAFNSVIDILKQDALYFDAVIEALQSDSIMQSNCIIQATRMGQEATEHLANLQDDFKVLERQIKENMKERDRAVKALRKEVTSLYRTCLTLVRIESDTEIEGGMEISFGIGTDMANDLEYLQYILRDVQTITHVSTFDDIFPRITDQVHHKKHLLQQLENNEHTRDSMFAKRNHAQLKLASLESSMVETTFAYKEEKNHLLKEIAAIEKTSLEMENETEESGNLFMLLRSSLQTIYEMISGITDTSETVVSVEDEMTTGDAPRPAQISISGDAQEILDKVMEKLKLLVKWSPEIEYTTLEKATAIYQKNVIELVSGDIFSDVEIYDVPLVDLDEVKDATILTRMDVKNNSKFIVNQFEHPAEFEMHMALPTFSKGAGDTKVLKNK